MKLQDKARKLPKEVKWRVDCDYLDKLSPEDRAYAEKFLAEYYLGDGLRNKDAIHTAKGATECRRGKKAAERDVLTTSPEDVAQALRPIQGNNARKRSRYSPSDYLPSGESPEQALEEIFDAE